MFSKMFKPHENMENRSQKLLIISPKNFSVLSWPGCPNSPITEIPYHHNLLNAGLKRGKRLFSNTYAHIWSTNKLIKIKVKTWIVALKRTFWKNKKVALLSRICAWWERIPYFSSLYFLKLWVWVIRYLLTFDTIYLYIPSYKTDFERFFTK